jgi:hypothetical protein
MLVLSSRSKLVITSKFCNYVSIFATWIENQVKRNSPANLMAINTKVSSLFQYLKELVPLEANL